MVEHARRREYAQQLSIDTRVMREILQRIEAGQRDGAQLRR
jgi:hypothetical protein